jgi:AraC family transcriptional regulator, transcriptional activator of pobA
MLEKDKIYSLDLVYNGAQMPFVIKTMEEIDEALGGIADIPHKHNYYSVIWPVKASGKHIIDFREYPIINDNIFFVNPGQVHQILSDPGPIGYVILFSPEFLEKNSIRKDFISDLRLFRNSDETPPLPISGTKATMLKSFADQMLRVFQKPDNMFLEVIGAYLKLFLIECNGHCTLMQTDNTQSAEVGKTLVKHFKSAVETHFSEWHQVKDYAEALYVTPNYLNEVIKSAMKISAKEFIQDRLILEAKRMAVFTEKSSKEIGYDLGFDDPSHFSKFFKSSTSKSFQEFKESVSL